MSSWLDVIAGQDLELAVPTFALVQGGAVRFRGSGRLHWRSESDVRIMAETDGASELRDALGRIELVVGQLVPQSEYVVVKGQTPDGWEVSTEPVSLGGYHVHLESPYVTWDFPSRSLTLTRARTRRVQTRMLRGLIGPPPGSWVRRTETEVRNDHFGNRSSTRDWLLYDSQLGQIAARKHSAEWFEVRVCLSGDTASSLDGFDILSAVRTAFSFVLGRQLLIRGFEDILQDREVHFLATDRRVTKSCLPTPPLGMGLTYLNNVETLLGHATNFFLSDSGGPLAQQLGVCWDTVDNHFFTQLAVASICVEALVGLSAATPVNHDRGFCSEDRIAISAWLDSHTRRLSTSFVNRVRGFIAALDHRRPVDVLRDWQREGILSVTDDDIRAWESIRHPAAHGRLQLDARSENEVQALLNAFHRVLNLINRIVLQLVGYEGAYVDYAQPGWPETPFLRTRPRC